MSMDGHVLDNQITPSPADRSHVQDNIHQPLKDLQYL